MVWQGVIIKESLEDDSLFKLVKILKTKKSNLEGENNVLTFHNVEIPDKDKDQFIEKAIKSLKYKFYLHLVKDKLVYVVFKDHIFKFSKGYPELETARNYGKSVGIPEEQMPFEYLITHPFA